LIASKQVRILLYALVHDGIDPEKLSEKAREEIRAALDVILELVDQNVTKI